MDAGVRKGWGRALEGVEDLDHTPRPRGRGAAAAGAADPFRLDGLVGADGFHVDKPAAEAPLQARVRASRRELEPFFSQLSILLESGVPVAPALDGLAGQARSAPFRRVLEGVRDDVQGGASLSIALERRPAVFPEFAVQMVRVGETSGTVGPSLRRVAGFLEHQAELVGRVRAAMAYPALMLVLSGVVLVFMLTFIIPRFQVFFSGKEGALPVSTKVLLWASRMLTEHALALVPGAVVLLAALVVFLRRPAGRRLLDGVKLRLPLLGGLFRRTALARSLGALAVLLRGGVPVLPSLRIGEKIAGNAQYAELWRRVADRVRDGGRVHEALIGSSLVPGPLVQMVAVGEEAGRLEDVLERAADYYQGQVQRALKEVTALLEPLMVVAVGGVVGFIAISLMLPIFTLSRTLR